MQQERGQQCAGLGQVQRALQRGSGGAAVAERVPGDCFQQESLGSPRTLEQANEGGCAVDDGGERGGRRLRVIPGEPQRRNGHAHLSAFTFPVPQFGEGIAGVLRFAEPHQSQQQQRAYRRDEVGGRGQAATQGLGGLQGGQRFRVPAAGQLQQPAYVLDSQHRGGLGLGPDGGFGPLNPGVCLVQAPLPGKPHSDGHASDAGGRVTGPAVPFRQFHRLPGVPGRLRE